MISLVCVKLPTPEQASSSLMFGFFRNNHMKRLIQTELKNFILCISEINDDIL